MENLIPRGRASAARGPGVWEVERSTLTWQSASALFTVWSICLGFVQA